MCSTDLDAVVHLLPVLLQRLDQAMPPAAGSSMTAAAVLLNAAAVGTPCEMRTPCLEALHRGWAVCECATPAQAGHQSEALPQSCCAAESTFDADSGQTELSRSPEAWHAVSQTATTVSVSAETGLHITM